MRANGVSGFPDPTQGPGGGVGFNGLIESSGGGLTVDGQTFSGPALQHGEKVCSVCTASRTAAAAERGPARTGAEACAVHAQQRRTELPRPWRPSARQGPGGSLQLAGVPARGEGVRQTGGAMQFTQ